MTYEEVNSVMAELATALKCEYAYSNFKSGARSRFLIFFYNGSDDLYADNINYQSIEGVRIDFYSPTKEINSEQTIKQILASHEISYSTTSAYIDSEKLHLTTFNTEVLTKWETRLSSA